MRCTLELHHAHSDMVSFTVLCAIRICLCSKWFHCTLLFVQLFALRASSLYKHNMGALSRLSVEKLERVPTLRFGRFVRCSAHGRSFTRLVIMMMMMRGTYSFVLFCNPDSFLVIVQCQPIVALEINLRCLHD